MTSSEQNKINIVFIGGIKSGKTALIDTIVNEEFVIKSYEITRSVSRKSVKFNELQLNLFDTPAFTGGYSDEDIGREINDYSYNLAICCLDGKSHNPRKQIKKSITFIEKYLPDIPVIFVRTRGNIMCHHDKFDYTNVQKYIRKNLKDHYLITVGNKISIEHPLWDCVKKCLPDYSTIISSNFEHYKINKNSITDDVCRWFLDNYEYIPKIIDKNNDREYNLDYITYAFFLLCSMYMSFTTYIIFTNMDLPQLQVVRYIVIGFLSLILVIVGIFVAYSNDYIGLFPIRVDNIMTPRGKFTGVLYNISKDNTYIKGKVDDIHIDSYKRTTFINYLCDVITFRI